MSFGPQLEFSEKLHAEKYRGTKESFKEAMTRIASSLADNDEHFHKFREILLDMRFLPGGRIQASIGSAKNITSHNCFVSGIIEDSFVEGHGSIMTRATEAATTLRMGGGIGYDFSTLRPRGNLIRKLNSNSSGPVSFMEIYNAICRCVASSGHRRGAQMGIMRIDHPDIEEFIRAKQAPPEAEPIMEILRHYEPGSFEWQRWFKTLQAVFPLTGFNISVAVTDEFMECVRNNTPFHLKFDGELYREVNAQALWETLMRSTWDWAEPGVLFIDQINRMNNLWYCENISATNPCSEQPLPPYGACLLGSFNLVKYLSPISYNFDFEKLKEDIPYVIRAMDNVIDKAIYPLYEQEKEAKLKRRMGIGVMGLANSIESFGIDKYFYGSSKFLKKEEAILKYITRHVYLASIELAKEKGSFSAFRKQKYLKSNFIQTLDEDIQDGIRKYGIRNSHLTSIAPTGTISLCADNVSSGIEPVFAYEQERTVILANETVNAKLQDYGYRVFNSKGLITEHVDIKSHLDVLITAQKHIDSSVSKTCNVSSKIAWEDFKNIYMTAWENGCKGCSTFQVGGKRAGVLKQKEESQSCYIDVETGRHECE